MVPVRPYPERLLRRLSVTSSHRWPGVGRIGRAATLGANVPSARAYDSGAHGLKAPAGGVFNPPGIGISGT